MSSKLQIRANRKNASSSTGPITDEGKSASSRNSFRHGLTSCAMTMILGENIEDYMLFANSLRAEHNAATPTEDALVTKMIESLWLSARAVRLQQSLFREPQYRRIDLDHYTRYQTMHDRAFSRALADLSKLRKAAREQEIGSVSQTQKQEVHVAKIRNINARSETQESTTQLQKARTAAVSAAQTPKVLRGSDEKLVA